MAATMEMNLSKQKISLGKPWQDLLLVSFWTHQLYANFLDTILAVFSGEQLAC